MVYLLQTERQLLQIGVQCKNDEASKYKMRKFFRLKGMQQEKGEWKETFFSLSRRNINFFYDNL